MTTNIGLVTSDAVVLGCDSIASTSGWFLNAFEMPWEADADGKPIQGPDGKFTLKFQLPQLQSIVTDAWGGVRKMFQIHPDPIPSFAVTAGLANLHDRPISSWADEFFEKHKSRSVVRPRVKRAKDSAEVATEFLVFMRAAYEKHVENSKIPADYLPELNFIVGSFGRDEAIPSVFRLKVKENTCVEDFGPNTEDHTGIVWDAQSDAIERFIRGYDGALRSKIETAIADQLKAHADGVNQYITGTVNTILTRLKQKLPAGVSVDVPQIASLELNWTEHALPIGVANLPVQEAVNFMAFLVGLQSGRCRFAHGVATVGGRTHIGLITKDKGLKLLNEPELVHRFTGFGDDL